MWRYLVISFLLLPSSAFALSFQMDRGPVGDFIGWISETTGENILLGPGVDGVVSLNVSDIDQDQVWPFFESVLNVNGYHLEKDKSFWHVIIKDRDIQQPIPFEQEAKDAIEEVKEKDFLYKVYSLHNVPVHRVFNSISQFLQGFPDVKDVSVFEKINGFGVSGREFDLTALDAFVQEVDRKYRQVLVEAIITEVVQDDRFEVGADVQVFGGDRQQVVSSLFSGVSDLSNLPTALVAALVNAGSYRGVLRVLETSDNARLLSTPRIVVNDGDKGEVFVGENVPFVTGRSTGEASDTENPFQVISRADVGVKLIVVPRVVSDELVSLEIRQEASSVTDSTLASDIITAQRHIFTTVDLRPGELLCLGGLRSQDQKRGRQGIPVLSDLPFIGWIFGGRRDALTERSLNVFLRVTLV